MASYELNRSVPLGSVNTLRIVTFIERVITSIAAWRSARATSVALSELSDRQLADIGIVRGEIPEIAAKLAQQ